LTRIGLISDTHGWLDEAVYEHFKDCDEVWHAGDFGAAQSLPLVPIREKEAPPILPGGEGEVVERMVERLEDRLGDRLGDTISYGDLFVQKFENLFGRKIIFRGVYGNIDTAALRMNYPEKLFFACEDVNVFMQHIGGYPGRYSKGVKEDIIEHKRSLFISGHSHILKIMYDQKLHCLHINPGAAGKQGWHKMRTIVRFAIDGKEIKDCEVVELGERGRIN